MERGDIEKITTKNKLYRKVINTTKEAQLVVMSLLPGEEIGEEVHPSTTQFIRIEQGTALARLGKKRYRLKEGDYVMIPSGVKHNIINTGKRSLKLYTVYSPPHHPPGTRQRVKPLDD